jgi:hypothetical protein
MGPERVDESLLISICIRNVFKLHIPPKSLIRRHNLLRVGLLFCDQIHGQTALARLLELCIALHEGIATRLSVRQLRS